MQTVEMVFFIIAGSFRVSLMIDSGGTWYLGYMPRHFCDT